MSSVPQKIRILHYIAQQGIVTLDDINAHLNCGDKIASIRVTLHRAGVGHVKYGTLKHGVWFIKEERHIELVRTYFHDLPEIPVRSLLLHHVPHCLELNRIRITLEQSSRVNVIRWWSEAYIRALPLSLREDIHNTKIPDAIFWRKKADGTEQKYFLEYERSLKNKERYEEIFRFYANREDVAGKNVIYICENDFIREELEDVEQRLARAGKLREAGRCFQFVTKESFYKSHEHSP